MLPAHPPRKRIEAGREAGLLLSAQGGDLDSFLELFREHQRALHRLCFALTCDPDRAAQLSSETARLAWRGVQRLRVGRPFFPFAARIARSLAVAHLRRQSGARLDPPERRPSGSPWGGGTGNPALAAEEQRLFAEFQALSIDDRMIVALRLLDGLSCAQIATVLGVPIGSVMHRLHGLRGRFESASLRAAA